MSMFRHQTFLGQPMTQLWPELPMWETFFNTHPIKTFIELGTGNGGMSLFFALQCYQRKIYFHTFDNQKFFDFDNGVPPLLNLWGSFHFVDLFGDEGRGQVVELIEKMPRPMAVPAAASAVIKAAPMPSLYRRVTAASPTTTSRSA